MPFLPPTIKTTIQVRRELILFRNEKKVMRDA
jgi:hypothetical protein